MRQRLRETESAATEGAPARGRAEVPRGAGSGATGGPAGSGEETFPIGRLAEGAGVSTRTVRYYEEIGLLPAARRYAGGRRVFDGDALQRLRFIGRLKTLGFSLEEISHLNEVFAPQRSTAAMLKVLDGQLGNHLEAIEKRVEELTALREELHGYRNYIRERLGKKRQ